MRVRVDEEDVDPDLDRLDESDAREDLPEGAFFADHALPDEDNWSAPVAARVLRADEAASNRVWRMFSRRQVAAGHGAGLINAAGTRALTPREQRRRANGAAS